MKNLQDFKPHDLKINTADVKHIFTNQDCHALWAAYASGRPLLLRGNPGTGKSQMAKAIASQLGWAFVSEVVRGNTELNDLHWHFDAVGRLGDAQLKSLPRTDNVDPKIDPSSPEKYLSPGVFWWAFNWQTAKKQYLETNTKIHSMPKEPTNASWSAKTGGVVLLLDEIDKGEPDLPNGLLETLGDYSFNVPHQSGASSSTKSVVGDREKVLVIITTNEERELPQAFVRRCFVHTLKLEDSSDKRNNWLVDRGRLHFGTNIINDAYHKAAEQLWDDRVKHPHKMYAPGLAEYIDLLRVLATVKPDEQIETLGKIAHYALDKDKK